MEAKDAHIKYRQTRQYFPCLKFIAYDIDKIWSIDFVYVNK